MEGKAFSVTLRAGPTILDLSPVVVVFSAHLKACAMAPGQAGFTVEAILIVSDLLRARKARILTVGRSWVGVNVTAG